MDTNDNLHKIAESPIIGYKQIILFSIFLLVIHFVLNVILIPIFGSIGAAIGTLCAETFVTAFQVIYLRKYIINKNNLITLLQTLISTFFMSVSVILICHLFKNILLKIFLSIFIGIILYIICLCLLKNKYFMEYFNLFKSRIYKKF